MLRIKMRTLMNHLHISLILIILSSCSQSVFKTNSGSPKKDVTRINEVCKIIENEYISARESIRKNVDTALTEEELINLADNMMEMPSHLRLDYNGTGIDVNNFKVIENHQVIPKENNDVGYLLTDSQRKEMFKSWLSSSKHIDTNNVEYNVKAKGPLTILQAEDALNKFLEYLLGNKESINKSHTKSEYIDSDKKWLEFKSKYKLNDELYFFRSKSEQGYVIIRGNRIIGRYIQLIF